MIDFDNDQSILGGITSAGAVAQAAGGRFEIVFPDGHVMAWVTHPFSGKTGEDLVNAVEGVRGTWRLRQASKEAAVLDARRKRKAALGADEALARDNVDAPVPSIILPSGARVAEEPGTTLAPAPGPRLIGPEGSPAHSGPSVSDDPLAYAKAQLLHALKMADAIEEQQAALDVEARRWSKASNKWAIMVHNLEGTDDVAE